MKKLAFYVLFLSFISCGGGKAQVEEAPAKTTTTKVTTKPQVANQIKTKTLGTTAPAAKTNSGGEYKAKNEGWGVNLEEAYAESQKTGKPIMANFTGSDWCGWCKRLDKSVFHQPGFEEWAEKNVVLLEVDFPRRFKLPQDVAMQNRSMQQSFGVRGYPTIWLFDAEKDASGKFKFNAIGKTGYTKTLAEFQKTMGDYISKRG